MAYLVRKLVKRDKLIPSAFPEDLTQISSDIPTTEFRTTNGTLSTWIVDRKDDIENAVLAIAITSSDISKMDFIIIDTQRLEANDLIYKQTYPGSDIGIPDLQETHFDIVDITLGKLCKCVNVYAGIVKEDADNDELIVRYTSSQIKALLTEAVNNHRVDREKVTGKIKEFIDKIWVA